ncbi:MAG: hypothetical protein RLZZ34_1749 [Verrucomicrobiota bacterium]
MTVTEPIPIETTDAINARILAVSEDRIQGYPRNPLGEIARLAELPVETVLERLRAMLQAGVIRRIRQTLLATSLAEGALCAWQVPTDRLDAAFDTLFQNDPFSGHVVLRSTDAATPGSNYKLWTTLKVPQGYSLEKHAAHLARVIGAEHYRLMSAKKLFALGVGHVRRRGMEAGARADEPAEAVAVQVTHLSEIEWRVLTALKREFAPDELSVDLWAARSHEAGLSLDEFHAVAEDLNGARSSGASAPFSSTSNRWPRVNGSPSSTPCSIGPCLRGLKKPPGARWVATTS